MAPRSRCIVVRRLAAHRRLNNAVYHCACQLWRRCRQRAGTRREFFEELRYPTKRECFPNWTVLFAALLEECPPPRPTPPLFIALLALTNGEESPPRAAAPALS